MDVRSPLFQNIALIVAGVLFLNPIVATAAQLAVDQAAGGNTAVTQAQNGVPMVNIATPNGSGLSHNKFTDYNVGQQGLILNNSAQNLVQTQLGGYVVGNPNLKNGAAGLILNEVTGGNASQLKGYTEVAGRSAAVIVANPHGITCDGCGFINTPRVTLSTGTPVIEDGRLQRFDVDGGQIAIEGQGLNAGNVDQFDLITRSAQINAELYAKKLNIVTGRNEVDASSLAATAKADDGSDKPMLAIDSSALGGMYAGAIRLVGTEQGVGVKLAGDMAASAGDIQIDANGKLSLARVAASNDLKLAANEIELNADTYAGRNATVTAMDQTLVKESLAAGNRLEIGGGELDNQGIVEAGVKANGALVTDSQLVLNSQRVSNRGELIARGSLEADVDVLDNSNGKLLSAGNAKIQAAQLANSQGQIIAQKSLELGGGALSNQDGELLAAGELRVDAASLNNQSGILAADSIDVKLTGALNNGQGLIESSQALKLDVDSAQNHDGRLRALASSGKSEFQIGNLFDNDRGLVEVGNAAFALASSSLSNLGGTVRHLGSQGFDLNLADLGNAGGRFITNGELNLSAADWTNTSELQAERLTLNIGQFTQAATGQLISRQSITATGDNWVNDGVIATDGALDLALSGSYEGNGALRSLGDLTFKADSAAFGNDAQVKSGGIGRFELSGQLLNLGRLTAAQDMFLKLGSLDNRGTLGGSGLLRIEGDSLRNEQGLIFSGADMTLRTASLTNLLGDIYSLGELDVARDEQGGNLDLLDNRSASIESSGDMTLRAAVLRNRKDVFDWRLAQTYGGISVVCYDCSGDHHNVDYVATERFEARVEADSASSRIHSGANLLLNGGEIANRYSTLSAAGDIDIDADSLENTGATLASVERVRRYNTGRVTDGTDERFRANYINPYNAQPLPKVLPGALGQWNLVSDIQRETPIGVAAPGIIQAGGDVRIQATQPITNESVLAHNAPQAGTEQTLETTVGGASAPLVVQLNPQLPADTAQQAVDPISLPGFSLPQGQNGLFQTNTTPGHRYLIETNPAFADLKQFVSSDYMLGLLGFDNDTAQKRLGDGLYEQRLLEQAIAARTGKRYLDGFTNNDAQFRYLMDNAIASKEALSLSVGVGLSSAQVAALTHDIVWLEEHEVNGEKVLVPVLYLAQVGDRLAPSGALIQGQDVALISGGSLNNSGTLRASENLSVTAASIGNSGLMQASDRLQLLATNSIRNAQGGIINGQDVSLTALTGDISNERTISQQSLEGRGFSQLTSVVDKAAGIEAGNDLQLNAKGDIQNIGGSIKAGGGAKLNAGGDVIIASATEEHGSMRKDKRHFWSTTSTIQHGSDVLVGGDLAVAAGQDIAVVASTVKAGGDVLLDAGRDVTIAAAANESSSEYHYKRSGKKIDKENSSVRQQAAVIEAGGDLDVWAEGNLILSASQLKAEGEAYLYAGEQLALLAAQNSDYYLYDMKKKGSWGSKKTQRDEVTTVRNVGSSITTGGDLTLVSEGDQLYQKARLESGNDLILDSGGSITFEAVKDLDQESHEKSKSSWAWTSAKGKGQTDETLKQSELIAQGDLVIQAVDGLKIDIKQVNQQSVSQTIDAMVKADPDLAWLKEAEARGDVDWRRVKEVHDSFKYSHSALGGPAAMIIAIVVTYLTWGAGSSLVGAAQGTWQAAAANTVVSSVASNAATSTINNRGNLGAAVKDVTSADAVRGYVVGGVTAGLTAGLFDGLLQTKTDPLTGKVTVDLSSLEGVGRFAGNQILQSGTSTILDRALGGDSSLSDVLRTSLANTFAAAGFNLIGDQTAPDKWDLKDGSVAKIGLHAVMGGLAAEAAGGDFKTGALAAGVNEALVDSLSSWYGEMDSEQKKSLLVMNSQVIGVLTAAAQGGDEKALQTGSWVAKNATQYNYTAHWDEFEKQHDACKKNPSGSGCSTVLKVAGVSSESLGNVVLNKDANGTIVSYTLLGDAGAPWMVMEPAEYKMYIASPQHIQEGYKTAPQWQLNLSSALLYAHHGDTEKAVENYAFMLRDPGYQQEMLLGLAMGGLGRLALGTKTTVAAGKPLVSKGSEVTPEIIQKALQGDPAISAQGAVSLPAVQRYVDRLLKGDIAPAIKMDGNVIVDGNHRYIAAKILGRNPDVTPGALPPNKVGQTKPVSELKVDEVDWGNR
ncbi:filamentous hemagglutinin family N-terminal domain-containing protein [Pseudomonas sp. NFACC19-2]|nr:DUF637 domain-containing protein [Pseudomonas sp. NFACC19-2]SFW24947.1 filamentous hemagglutinin family N-terminal domain-containing protein [Pseudomonas sp. NFACC19-2]